MIFENFVRPGIIYNSKDEVDVSVWAAKAEWVGIQVRPLTAPPPIEDHSDAEIERLIDAFIRLNHSEAYPYKRDLIKNNPYHFIFGNMDSIIPLEKLNKERLKNLFGAVITLPEEECLYRYVVKYPDSDDLVPLKDPKSQFQPFGTDGWSQFIDHTKYEWKHSTVRANPYAVIQEAHIGTYTAGGTFESLQNHLFFCKDLSACRTIQILPFYQFYGNYGWGYDGVDLYAPHNTYCVTSDEALPHPNALKTFIDTAHGYGYSIIFDFVANHMGPYYSVLQHFSNYAGEETRWGKGYNHSSSNVCAYLIQSLLFWLEVYNFDGVRMDATYKMPDSSVYGFSQIMRSVKQDIFLIAEDKRNIKRLVERQLPWGRGWYDAQWNIDFPYTLEAFFSKKNLYRRVGNDYYTYNPSLENIKKLFTDGFLRDPDPKEAALPKPPPHALINYIESHDEPGNYGGERFLLKYAVLELERIYAKHNTPLPESFSDKVNKLLWVYLTVFVRYEWSDYPEDNWQRMISKVGLHSFVEKDVFLEVMDTAISIRRVALGLLYFSPGSKQDFHSERLGECFQFKFFGEYPVENIEEQISSPADKGYDVGMKAYLDSKNVRYYYIDPLIKNYYGLLQEFIVGNFRYVFEEYYKPEECQLFKLKNIFIIDKVVAGRPHKLVFNLGSSNRKSPVSLYGYRIIFDSAKFPDKQKIRVTKGLDKNFILKKYSFLILEKTRD